MALETLRKSDYSGEPIPPKTGARVRVIFFDGETLDRRADITDAEVEELLGFTTPVEPRPQRKRFRA